MLLALGLAACGVGEPRETSGNTLATIADVRLTSPDPAAYAFFGHAVAIDGSTAVVGAWGVNDNAGSVYVFAEVDGAWQLEASLRAPDGSPKDRFGHAVAIDGDRVVVGAVHESTHGFRAGAAHVFEREEGSWSHVSALGAPAPLEYQQFGSSVAVDGDTLAVGASGFSGRAAYVHTRVADSWSLQQVVKPQDDHQDARFGSSLALVGDTLVVGAWTDEPFDHHEPRASGLAYVFERHGGDWHQTTVLDSPTGEPGYGSAVATDGATIVVSTPNEAVHIYARERGSWRTASTLEPSEVRHYGTSVAVDGDKVLVGASGKAGAAYEYHRVDGTWTLQHEITAADATETLHFGLAAAVSGQRSIFGATGADDGGIASGAAYLFP